MYIDITDKQFYELLDTFIEECGSTERMHKLVMKCMRHYSMFQGADMIPIEKIINKHKKEHQEDGW